MEEYVTACPRNCYSTCSFRVLAEKNRIIKILPYAGNLATPEGPCIKGLSYIERAHSSERIIHPLIRTEKGFSPVAMKEALGIVGDKMLKLRQEHGPHSILWYKGSGMSGLTNEIGSAFWKAFGGATTTYGNLCWPAGLEAVRLTLGSVKHNVPWDLENAGAIIIWGKNPAETNIQETVFIAKARDKGARIVVIDPLRTPTTDKADILFSPKPGTDAGLALAVARILVEEELVDIPFIEKYVEGFDEFRKSLEMTCAQASLITGIPEEGIRELAMIIGTAKPLTILPGYGLQRHLNGGQTIRSILSLSVITGNIGKPGAGFNYANLQSYIFDDVLEPESYYPDPARDHPFRRTLSMAKLGKDMLGTTTPELRMAWIERGNPLLQSPDSFNVRNAFARLDFRVVVEQFMNDTAAVADIILPAKDIFEQSDIVGSYWSPYVQFKPKVIDPPGEVLPESEIYWHLAQYLNLDVNDQIPEPGNSNIERWLEKRIKGYSELTLDDLRKGPVLAPGLQHIAYEDKKFETPSGRIELLSSRAIEWGIDPLPRYVAVNGDNPRFRLHLLTPNAGSRIHSQFGNLDVIRKTVDAPGTGISPGDAKVRGISDGDRIRIFNDAGEIFSVAKISSRVPGGCAVLPNGIWLSEGGGGNALISGRETDIGYGAAFHDNMVEIERDCNE